MTGRERGGMASITFDVPDEPKCQRCGRVFASKYITRRGPAQVDRCWYWLTDRCDKENGSADE